MSKIEILKSVLSAFGPFFTGVGTFGIYMVTNSSAERSNKNEAERLAWEKTKHQREEQERRRIEMKNSKAELRQILYGQDHKAVSNCAALLIARISDPVDSNSDHRSRQEDSEQNYRSRCAKAEDWYKKYKSERYGIRDMSLEQQEGNATFQVNMCRSLLRDNFIRMASLMESYATSLNELNELRQPTDQKTEPEMISGSDANEIFNRYQRFHCYVKPFDDVMGYLQNDGLIYDQDRFKKTILDVIPNSQIHSLRQDLNSSPMM
ncbi:hypothetical protein MP638_006019 [Amoeboaphelidium occidentale]|nr:hypothetical protein MP638_006019 [Amoeboaphelidium occidentale]